MGVILLYLAVNFVYVTALGVSGLASTTTPASDVMRLALGKTGARVIAAGIAISTLGFLSQGMLTAPRVYFAMAEDGLFFRSVGKLNPKTKVPIVAIVLQGVLAVAIALWGKYEQILNYVVSVDFIFFGATAACIFVFRRRAGGSRITAEGPRTFAKVPGHPLTTALFVAINDAEYVLEPVAEALLLANLSRAEALPSLRIAAERSLRLAADDRGLKIPAVRLKELAANVAEGVLDRVEVTDPDLVPPVSERRGLPAAMAARLA